MGPKTKNLNLNKAKQEKNDEYFTRVEDIEQEIKHYCSFIKGKRILCNCNDYPGTSFFDFFISKFKQLGIISVTGIKYNENGKGVKYFFNGTEVIGTELSGNGSFSSEECLGLIGENDIVITNPPFSKFVPYLSTLVKSNTYFLIIGSINACTNNTVLNLIKENKVWLGSGDNHLSMWFGIPDEYERNGNSLYVDKTGKRFWKVCGTVWFTNIDGDFRHKKIELKNSIRDFKYEKFDNIDAINVTRYNKIPYDYDGLIGVPVSFLDKYCVEQFEIVGNEDDFKLFKGRTYINGKRMYSRIFIRKK